MFKCTALLFLASVAVSTAVPIGTYGGIYGVDRLPSYGKSYISDYTRNIFGGYPYGLRRYGLGYGYGDIGVTGKWNDIYNIYGTIGDIYPTGIYDTVVPEGLRKNVIGGNIYDLVKKHQLGDLLEMNDKHTLEQTNLMAGQNTVRDLLNEQQEKTLENKEVLDRLDVVGQVDMQKQKEKLEMMQWLQKLQLDQVHSIEDAKITGYRYPGAGYGRYMRGIYGYGPYNVGYNSAYPYTGIMGGIF